MANPVVHFEVNGKDGDALAAYYGKLFGWSMQAMPEMGYNLVPKPEDGSGIGGGIGTSQDGSTSVTFYVQVDDPQGALDKAVELGGKVVAPVMSIPGMVTLAQFADPEGNVVGLVASETPPA
ncbi:MAG: VOC family protein [Gaiella sp.]